MMFPVRPSGTLFSFMKLIYFAILALLISCSTTKNADQTLDSKASQNEQSNTKIKKTKDWVIGARHRKSISRISSRK